MIRRAERGESDEGAQADGEGGGREQVAAL